MVDTTSNVVDGDVTTIAWLIGAPGSDNEISFPEAVAAINNTARQQLGGAYAIRFNLPHGSVITLPDSLLLSAGHTTINGDVDGNGRPDIALTASPGTRPLILTSSENVIANLAISGLRVQGASTINNLIIDSYIGTDVEGLTSQSHGLNGIELADGAHANVITNNVIAGNRANVGIDLSGIYIGTASHDNLITGNRIGLNAAEQPVPNAIGVSIAEDSYANTIGGDRKDQFMCGLPGDPCNVISGNTVAGVVMTGSSTRQNGVRGNTSASISQARLLPPMARSA